MIGPARPFDLLTDTLGVSRAGVVVVDREGRVVQGDGRAAVLLGVDETALPGADAAASLAGAGDPQEVRRILSTVLDGEAWEGYVRTGGDARLHLRAVPIRDGGGAVAWALCTIVDQDRDENLREALAVLESLQRNSPVGHILFDLSGRYLRVNDAMLAMNGGTREERIGRLVEDVQPDVALQVRVGLDEVAATGQPWRQRVEGRVATRPGEARVWRASYYPVHRPDGTLFAVGVIAEDVTAQERSARYVDVTGAVSRALLPALTLDDVVTAVLGSVSSLLGAASAGLVLGDPGTGSRLARLTAGGTLGWEDLSPDVGGRYAEVARGNEPVTATDEDDVQALLPGSEVCAVVGLSLPAPHGGTIGALLLGYDHPLVASDAEAHLRRTAANQCAGGLRRAQLFEQVEIAATLSQRLQQATGRLARAAAIDEVASGVLDEARRTLGAAGGGFGIVDDRRRTHRFVSTFGWDHLALAGLLGERPLDALTLSGSAIRLGQALYISGPEELEAFMPADRARRTAAPGAREAWVVAPLVGAAGPVGSISLSFPTARTFTHQERSFVEALAGQAALAVDRVRRYQAEHQVAVTLQQALLPGRLPIVPGLAVAVRYLAGSGDVQVGGDWYDLFTLEDDSVVLSVGDVAGHDLVAAGTMGRLRAQLRACASVGRGPGHILTELERLVYRSAEHEEELATVVCATWAPGGDALALAVAGHPPPLLRTGTSTAFVECSPGPPLGATSPPSLYGSIAVALDPTGSTVVFYTDGLVERPGEDPSVGLERLRSLVDGSDYIDPNDLADHLLDALAPAAGWADDVALMVCHIAPTEDA